MPEDIIALARKCGADVESWLTNPPKVGRVCFTPDQLRSFVEAIREKDAELCQNERVNAEATGEEHDRIYNLGVRHCEQAIRRQIAAIRQASTEGGRK